MEMNPKQAEARMYNKGKNRKQWTENRKILETSHETKILVFVKLSKTGKPLAGLTNKKENTNWQTQKWRRRQHYGPYRNLKRL